MAGFAKIADEAEQYAERAFESYASAVGEADPGDFAEETRDQGAVASYESPGTTALPQRWPHRGLAMRHPN